MNDCEYDEDGNEVVPDVMNLLFTEDGVEEIVAELALKQEKDDQNEPAK